jgi:hypothetical protein
MMDLSNELYILLLFYLFTFSYTEDVVTSLSIYNVESCHNDLLIM